MASVDSFNELPDDVLLAMIEDPLFDENDPSWQQSAEDYMADAATLDLVDITSGAPFNVRAAVNAAQSEEDRLATLKNFYPGAVRVEDLSPEFGAQRFGAGNFVYEDPETQELTLFDERGGLIFGASIADLTADIGPEIAETVGFKIIGPDIKIIYLPDIDNWDKIDLQNMVKKNDSMENHDYIEY